MDHADIPGHRHLHDPLVPGALPQQTYFPEEEWRSYQEEDIHGARRVVGLMFAIFLIGLALYTGVATWVSNRPFWGG